MRVRAASERGENGPEPPKKCLRAQIWLWSEDEEPQSHQGMIPRTCWCHRMIWGCCHMGRGVTKSQLQHHGVARAPFCGVPTPPLTSAWVLLGKSTQNAQFLLEISPKGWDLNPSLPPRGDTAVLVPLQVPLGVRGDALRARRPPGRGGRQPEEADDHRPGGGGRGGLGRAHRRLRAHTVSRGPHSS